MLSRETEAKATYAVLGDVVLNLNYQMHLGVEGYEFVVALLALSRSSSKLETPFCLRPEDLAGVALSVDRYRLHVSKEALAMSAVCKADFRDFLQHRIRIQIGELEAHRLNLSIGNEEVPPRVLCDCPHSVGCDERSRVFMEDASKRFVVQFLCHLGPPSKERSFCCLIPPLNAFIVERTIFQLTRGGYAQ